MLGHDASAQERTKYSETIREKNLQMYKEIKKRKMNKIKSKLYRSIRKKRQKKDEIKRADLTMAEGGDEMDDLLERQETERARERITLRHRNKNKFLKNLKKYGGEDNLK